MWSILRLGFSFTCKRCRNLIWVLLYYPLMLQNINYMQPSIFFFHERKNMWSILTLDFSFTSKRCRNLIWVLLYYPLMLQNIIFSQAYIFSMKEEHVEYINTWLSFTCKWCKNLIWILLYYPLTLQNIICSQAYFFFFILHNFFLFYSLFGFQDLEFFSKCLIGFSTYNSNK